MDPITQRLTTLVQKAGADGKFGFFERRDIKKALSEAIERAPSIAKVDEYCGAVRAGVGSARWGAHDFTSSWTYERTAKLADARRAELGVDQVLPRIAALTVSPRLKSAIEAIARAGEASGAQQDAVRDAYLAELATCTTVRAVGELYWTTFEVLKNYRRTGLGHDAWWSTGADQTMRSASAERQMKLDASIHLFPYNDAPCGDDHGSTGRRHQRCEHVSPRLELPGGSCLHDHGLPFDMLASASWLVSSKAKS